MKAKVITRQITYEISLVDAELQLIQHAVQEFRDKAAQSDTGTPASGVHCAVMESDAILEAIAEVMS